MSKHHKIKVLKTEWECLEVVPNTFPIRVNMGVTTLGEFATLQDAELFIKAKRRQMIKEYNDSLR